MNERRYKRLWIDPNALMTLLWDWQKVDTIALPIIEGIPQDAEIRGIEYSFEHDAFLVKLEHSSFEPVSKGRQIPIQIVEFSVLNLKKADLPQLRETKPIDYASMIMGYLSLFENKRNIGEKMMEPSMLANFVNRVLIYMTRDEESEFKSLLR